MTSILRGDGFVSAVLIGLPVMELADAPVPAGLAFAIAIAAVLMLLAWVGRGTGPSGSTRRSGAQFPATSAAGNEVRAQAVFRLVDDLLDPQAVQAIGKIALDDLPGRGAKELHAQGLKHGDQPGRGIGVAGKYHSHHAPLAACFIAHDNLRVHRDDLRWHCVRRDERGALEKALQRLTRLEKREIGEIGFRDQHHHRLRCQAACPDYLLLSCVLTISRSRFLSSGPMRRSSSR